MFFKSKLFIAECYEVVIASAVFGVAYYKTHGISISAIFVIIVAFLIMGIIAKITHWPQAIVTRWITLISALTLFIIQVPGMKLWIILLIISLESCLLSTIVALLWSQDSTQASDKIKDDEFESDKVTSLQAILSIIVTIAVLEMSFYLIYLIITTLSPS